MKVILSRKGFDSGYGGYPSIILPNNEMITLPIPCPSDYYRYSDISTKNGEGECLYNIMKSLKNEISFGGEKKELTKETHCHLDPDLCDFSVERDKNWKGIFGQIDASTTVLNNNGVKEGDLFLFFGWFNDVIIEDNKYKFTKGDGRHTIFGYLQIDKILHPKYDKVPEEFNKHPHVYDSKRKEKDTDTIYIAKDVCTFDNNIKGYGIFKYDEKLDLTKKGMNRTCWDLPDFFKGVKIAYHNENSFKEGYFKSACRGQEFVIEDNKDVEEWAINLIKEHSTNRIK